MINNNCDQKWCFFENNGDQILINDDKTVNHDA